jgi:hypothetical protein
VWGTSTTNRRIDGPVTLRASIHGKDRLADILFEEIFLAGFADVPQIGTKWEPNTLPFV